MQTPINQKQYEAGLATFIETANNLISVAVYPMPSAAINHDIREWYRADQEINAYSHIGTIKKYLEFAYSAGGFELENEQLEDFHKAFFELAAHYKEEKETINLDAAPKMGGVNYDFMALEDVLPEWLDNFADGFNPKNKTFKILPLTQ